INPDRLALVEREETVYSDMVVQPDHPPEVRTGQLLHTFPDSDYEFQEFPPEIQSKSKRVTKTRVGLVPAAGPQERLLHALGALPPDQVPGYLKRVVQVEPDDAFALQFLARLLPPAEAIDFLRPRLADRPVRVEWHRVYQSLVELADP